MRLLVVAATAYIVYETVQGWRTGQISYRGLKGDRITAPATYWFLMVLNVLLLVGVLPAVLGIYGEPI